MGVYNNIILICLDIFYSLFENRITCVGIIIYLVRTSDVGTDIV